MIDTPTQDNLTAELIRAALFAAFGCEPSNELMSRTRLETKPDGALSLKISPAQAGNTHPQVENVEKR